MSDFADFADAGRRLGDLLLTHAGTGSEHAVVLAVMPHGVPVGVEVARVLRLPLVGAVVTRDDDGLLEVENLAGLGAWSTVIVVDDGVETGTAAVSVGRAVREAGAQRVLLAVPVCPRESSARLVPLYDEVIAVVRPLARRSLSWHYDQFESITFADAQTQLADYTSTGEV